MPDWNKAYAGAQRPLFGDEPTDFVRAVVERSEFQCRTALCLADGDGRIGRWLAQQALAVSAIDISDEATRQAIAKDRQCGVTVERTTADLAHWRPTTAQTWDAIFVIFLQCEAEVRHAAIGRASQHLRPNGWLVVEGFAGGPSGRTTIGPKDPNLLYDLGELRSSCVGLSVHEARVDEIRLNEGVRHQGSARVVRFIARRPVDASPLT
ncbi:MAG: class I SAM-dependent methyltransferase [Hyphomicrobiaceae bacterium]